MRNTLFNISQGRQFPLVNSSKNREDEENIQIRKEFHLNQSHMVAGWEPTISGPRATGRRFETTCSTVEKRYFKDFNLA